MFGELPHPTNSTANATAAITGPRPAAQAVAACLDMVNRRFWPAQPA